MHAESWELDLNSEFRVLTSWISLTLSSTIQNACNNKNDLKVGIDFQCSMNMVPKCRAQFMHDWIPAVLSARTRDCRRRPDLIARAENHNSTQPGCHVASRTRSTDLQKMVISSTPAGPGFTVKRPIRKEEVLVPPLLHSRLILLLLASRIWRALHESVNFVHDPEKQYKSLSVAHRPGGNTVSRQTVLSTAQRQA